MKGTKELLTTGMKEQSVRELWERKLEYEATLELLDQLEMRLHHRHQYQLRDALADGDGERRLAAVSASISVLV